MVRLHLFELQNQYQNIKLVPFDSCLQFQTHIGAKFNSLQQTYKNMQAALVQLNLSSDNDQSAKLLFDQIELSQQIQHQNNDQSKQQKINMKDYRIKKSKKEKKKLKKYKKTQQIKEKTQKNKMKIQSDDDKQSMKNQNDQQLEQNSQQYSLHQDDSPHEESNSEQQAIANLNPNQQQQDEKSRPKRLKQQSKKWLKQKLVQRSSSKKQKIQKQQGFKLDQLGNQGIVDQLNQSMGQDDDSFSNSDRKGKKKNKNKKAKNGKVQKQKLTNQQFFKKLNQIGCEQSQGQLDSERYNVDSGIDQVQRMKGGKQRQDKKLVKIANKLFENINIEGQMPPPAQQNFQLELKPKTSHHSVSSSFLSRIQTIKKNRGLQANVDEVQFQKMNKQKNKRSITKLVSKLNDQIQKDEQIDLMVRVPSFSRGKSADIINNTLYIKTYSQMTNRAQGSKIQQIVYIKNEAKQAIKNQKSRPVSRNQFFKNMKTDVQLRRSKYISDEELINNIKKTGLQQLEEFRKKLQQKRNRQTLLQLGQFDQAEDYIEGLEEHLNQKGISKKQLKKLIEMEDGQEADGQEEADQSQSQSKKQSYPQQHQKQSKKAQKQNGNQIITENQNNKFIKKISQKYSQKGSNNQKMDVQQPDMVEQFQDVNQVQMNQQQNQEGQKIINEGSEADNEDQSDRSAEDQQGAQGDYSQNKQDQQNKQNAGNAQNIEQIQSKLNREEEIRRKQLEQMEQEGIAIKKRYLYIDQTQDNLQKLNIPTIMFQENKQNADQNIQDSNHISELDKHHPQYHSLMQQEQQNQQILSEKQSGKEVKQTQKEQQNFKQFKKLRKIATIIAQKRQKRDQQLKRAKQFFQQQAQLGSDNQQHDEIVKKINKKEQDDEYDGADLDQELQELIDNAVDINQENQREAFKKYMQNQKQRDRQQLQKILRGEFKRKQIDIELEEDQKNRMERREKMIKWIEQQEQDQAGLYAKQSSEDQDDDYYGYKGRHKHRKQKQSDHQMQGQQQQEQDKQQVLKKLQMYLEDSISPAKNNSLQTQFSNDFFNTIPESNIRQKQAIGMSNSKKVASSTVHQPGSQQKPKYSTNSLFGGLLNLTGPSKNNNKQASTGAKLKKTFSHMNQVLKKTVSQTKKGSEGIKLPMMFSKSVSVKK